MIPKILPFVALAACALFWPSGALADAPANDDFAAAQTITSLPFSDTVDNAQATTETGEPAFCGPTTQTVWYRITPASTTVLRADTSGTGFLFSELAVYEQTGSGFGGLSFKGCAFDSVPLLFTAEAGQTYYLQAASFFAGAGSVHVGLQAVPPPPNDDFEQAMPITSLPFSADLDLSGATTQPGEPSPCGVTPKGTAWYAFTPGTSGTYTGGSTSPSGFTFVVAFGVYTGTGFGSLTSVSCNVGNPLQFDAERGKTYYIQVANAAGLGSVSTFSLRLLRADDTTPPLISPTVTGTLGNDGWYVSDVDVSWSVTDPESAITAQTGCDATAITADTTGETLTCTATSAGGTAMKSVTIKRDATAPKVTCAATPDTIWPPTHKLVPVTTAVTVTDATSGPGGFALTGATTSEGTPSLDVVDWTIGTADTSGELRSERLGTDVDRVYTLTYRGSDAAGNTAICAALVTVPHDQGQ